MNGPNKMPETWMETAASEALGANSPEESAAYQRDLAHAGNEAAHTDRALRETVARLSAASPYMAPPADLRGRLLQATAPATFKMEDYRKANQENSRFYRWGFYAAMFFLMAGAYYNLSTKAALKQSQNQVAVVTQKANDLLSKSNQQTQGLNTALAAFVSPTSQQINLKSGNETFGRAIVNQETASAVLILPEELVPQNQPVTLQMPVDGKLLQYRTLVIKAPAKELHVDMANLQPLQPLLNPKSVEPDTSPRTYNASFGQ